MNWKTQAPPHTIDFSIFAQVFNPTSEKNYCMLQLTWCKDGDWDDETQTHKEGWVSLNGFSFTDQEIFAWISVTDLEEDCKSSCNLNISNLIQVRNL